ncbi:hypothetical protein F4804DRAFT_326500 [Jackrogersella minutella]|nr:hypothetical protein F4804DRAFT_326500 [Jackrogersella minutella]
MQGRPVPFEFRLNGAISVSHRDLYSPGFHGLSYDEMRLEVARQSLVAASQRAPHHWISTPVSESGRGDRNALGPAPERPKEKIPSNVDASSGIRNVIQKTALEEATAPASQSHDPQASMSANKASDRGSVGMNPHISESRKERSLSTPPGRQSFTGASTNALGSHGSELDLSNRKPEDVGSNRTTTLAILRRLLVDEAKKRQRPSAPENPAY